MKPITAEQFEILLKNASIKPRFKRDLKFRGSTEHMDEMWWAETEMLPVWNKSKNGGVIVIELADERYLVAFDATKPDTDVSGRSKSVICDLCYTWLSGGNGGFVTFYPNKNADRSVSLLCCTDLRCSDNVRTKTSVSFKSRTQLRENMTNDDRVQRLRQKLETFVERLQVERI